MISGGFYIILDEQVCGILSSICNIYEITLTIWKKNFWCKKAV
jgi:hypothetical protein